MMGLSAGSTARAMPGRAIAAVMATVTVQKTIIDGDQPAAENVSNISDVSRGTVR
jgi:hypothetical protein